jgi:hypothetical protein
MLRTLIPLAAAAAVFGSTGCTSTARYVDRTPTGGVVAVPDYQHRDDAIDLIKDHVGPKYVILDEREEQTGKTVTATTDTKSDKSVMVKFLALFSANGETGKTTTTTGPVTEYRIYYQKAGVPMSAGGPQQPGTVIQTQYLSPGTTPAAGPTSIRNTLSPFDTGGACKL